MKEFCPNYCLFDPDDPNPALKEVCDNCYHSKDVVIKPTPVIVTFKQSHQATAVGTNGELVYIKDKDGISMVHKDRVEPDTEIEDKTDTVNLGC